MTALAGNAPAEPRPASGRDRVARAIGRLAGAAAALILLYALGRTLAAHKIGQQQPFFDALSPRRLAPGEALLLCGYLAVGTLSAGLLARAIGPGIGRALGRLLARRRAPLVLAALAVGGALALGASFRHGPLLPEETGCEFAARALLRGRLTVPGPPDPAALAYPFVADRAGRRFGSCGPAQAALVAAGRLAGGATFVLPALLLGALVLLVGALARELAGDDPAGAATAGLAAALAAISPALVVAAATTDGALTAAVGCLATVRFGLALARRGRRADAVAAGLCAGITLLVHPVEIVAVVLPAALFLALRARRAGDGLPALLRRAAPALLCGLPFLVVALAANAVTTGHPLVPPSLFQAGLPAGARLGSFGVAMVRLSVWLFGWPLSLLPFGILALGGARPSDTVLWLPVGGLAVWALLAGGGPSAAAGPLHLLPAVPLLALAAARALGWVEARAPGWALAAVLGATLAAAGGFWRLVVVHETGGLARRAAAPLAAARRQGIARGLVLVPPGLAEGLPPAVDLADPLVFASEPSGREVAEVRAWLAGRPVYRYFYTPAAGGELVPSSE